METPDADDQGLKVLVGLCFQVIFATHIARYRLDLSIWLFMLCFVVVVVFVLLKPVRSAPPAGAAREDTPASSNDASIADATWVGTLASIVIGIAMAAVLPFGLGLAAWDALVWLTGRLNDGTLAGFRPASVPSEAIGGLTVLVAAIGVFIWQARQQRLQHNDNHFRQHMTSRVNGYVRTHSRFCRPKIHVSAIVAIINTLTFHMGPKIAPYVNVMDSTARI